MVSGGYSISQPAHALLRQAGVDPKRVNEAIERRLGRGQDARLRPHHYYLRVIRKSTGVPLVSISRRNRCLLIDIDNPQSRQCYVEYSRNDCGLRVPGQLPATVVIASPGLLLGQIVKCIPLLAEYPIRKVGALKDLLNIQLQIGWIKFA